LEKTKWKVFLKVIGNLKKGQFVLMPSKEWQMLVKKSNESKKTCKMSNQKSETQVLLRSNDDYLMIMPKKCDNNNKFWINIA
ncbi:hypothetical protein CVR96_26690, partial [Salmonella enterica subsp. enterica serovar Typhimurium]